MTNLIPLFIFSAILHITIWGAGIFLTNLGDTPFYGGATGFLPSTGDAAHPYDTFSAWLAGGGPSGVDQPSDEGGISIFRWIVVTPLCGMVSLIKTIISLGILNYDLVQLLPSDGFGNWIKIIINCVGALITLTLFARLVEFAIRAGVFSNIYMMGLVLGVAAVGVVAALLNAGGALSCG